MNKTCIPYDLKLTKKKTIKNDDDRFLIGEVTSGNLDVKIDNRTYKLKECELVVFKPDTSAIFIPTIESQIKFIEVDIKTLNDLSEDEFDFIEKLNYVPYDVAIVHIDIKEYLVLKNILNRILTIQTDSFSFGLKTYEKHLLASFLILLLRACIKSDSVHKQNNRKTLIIDDVFIYIQKNINDDLSLKQLENVFHVSLEHLSRRFKTSTGMTIHEYITNTRIDLSKKYLLDGKSVSEICDLVGFGSYNHFFKAFKKYTGQTPSKYLNSYKK